MNTENIKTMRVETLNFAGNTVTAIMGHTDHELLFIAKQVVDASGLKYGSQLISLFVKQGGRDETFLRLKDVYNKIIDVSGLVDCNGRKFVSNGYLMTEPQVYKMLLRGRAESSEPFRKWVTEEVLPTIRKTGSYNVEQSTTEEGKLFAAEFAALRDTMEGLKAEVISLRETIATLKIGVPAEKSPYEGQAGRCIYDTFNVKEYRRLCEVQGLDRLSADRLEGKVVLRLESMIALKWKTEDSRTLTMRKSTRGREWTAYPADWLSLNLTISLYREAIKATLNEMINR